MHMADASVIVIGGGVVGLAIAAELSQHYSPLFLLERYPKVGQETSSRNSEVIHAGIYYPSGSLKARLCVEGRQMLYRLCESHGIPHRRITKIITATRPEDFAELERLETLGKGNGVDLTMLTAGQVRELEPQIVTVGGMLSPGTGIISAHGLMDYYSHAAMGRGAVIQTHCTVVGLEKRSGDFRVTVQEGDQRSSFTSDWVINAAGLESDTIASLAGIDVDAAGYRLHYCKGCYFALPASLSTCVSRLVYPVPNNDSLGVHAVIDLGGRLKFGPDVEYIKGRELDYRVDPAKRHLFAESVRRILPHVRDEDLSPDMGGMRPKLQAEGEAPRDFIIRHESDRGLAGLVNLIGIDSPGLTASPAIAQEVARLITRAGG
jgi:L-2-hydroxyglutarate oxidase LhgO